MSIVKTIGNSGQISLGEEFAGRSVLVEELEAGVWMIKVGEFIPDNERWLHEPETEVRIRKALESAQNQERCETDLDGLERRLNDGRSTRSEH